jgi:hypothetical protein
MGIENIKEICTVLLVRFICKGLIFNNNLLFTGRSPFCF